MIWHKRDPKPTPNAAYQLLDKRAVVRDCVAAPSMPHDLATDYAGAQGVIENVLVMDNAREYDVAVLLSVATGDLLFLPYSAIQVLVGGHQ